MNDAYSYLVIGHVRSRVYVDPVNVTLDFGMPLEDMFDSRDLSGPRRSTAVVC